MVQLHLEVIANLIVFFAYMVITIICLIKGFRKKNPPLLIFSLFLIGWTLGTGCQTLAYMILENTPLETQTVALNLKIVAGLLIMASNILWFIWMDYVQFERVRPWAITPIVVTATLFSYAIVSPAAFQLDIYMEGIEVIGISMSKVGLAQYCDAIGIGLVYFTMAWYFAVQIRHAPPKLKPLTQFLTIFIAVGLVVVMIINAIVRNMPANGMAMLLYAITMLCNAIVTIVLILTIIRVPQLLYLLSFKVSRLLVIEGTSGIALFDYKFSEHNVDVDLFSGLLQGFQAMTAEVLQQGALREIRLDQGTLFLLKYPQFTLGLIASRSSRFLAKCLDQFAHAFDARFHARLEEFSGDITDIECSVDLVDQIFEYIPRYAHTMANTINKDPKDTEL
jgi:hypothetical protein